MKITLTGLKWWLNRMIKLLPSFLKPKPLELSAAEIYAGMQGKDKNYSGKRIKSSFRMVPVEVADKARDYFDKTKDINKTITYIVNAFFIYRGCAGKLMFAPLHYNKEAYEWPSPAEFSWNMVGL